MANNEDTGQGAERVNALRGGVVAFIGRSVVVGFRNTFFMT